MKASTIFCVLLTIAMGAQLIHTHAWSNEEACKHKHEAEEIYLEGNEPISGMFFSSEYVTEEYEYDDVYCLRYDDADANLFDVEIAVDSETYQNVIESINSGREMVGSLVLNEDLSNKEMKVFSFVSDSEKL